MEWIGSGVCDIRPAGGGVGGLRFRIELWFMEDFLRYFLKLALPSSLKCCCLHIFHVV